jgi:hypothetical protein
MTFLAGRLAQTHRSLAALALVAGLAATPAEAAQVLFELTGDTEATFVLDQSPVPDFVIGSTFTLPGPVVGTLNGADVEFTQFAVFVAGLGHAFRASTASNSAAFLVYGPQLYSGTPASPTFVPGAYAMTDLRGGDYLLTISNAVAEPSTWALMILGFGAAGAILRRREMLRAS